MLRLLAVVALCLLAGCMDQDPFGASTRYIRGEYELKQWEDGSTYYLQGPSHIQGGGWGALEGTVERIGWSDERILVWQKDCGNGGGWRSVDVAKQFISPILTQAQIDADPQLHSIQTMTTAEAWKRLD